MSDPNAPQPEDAAAPQPPAAPVPPAPPAAAPPTAVPPQYATPPQYAQQPPQYAAAAPQPLTAESDRQLAMWAHIGGIVGFIPSLVIWLMFKDRGPRVDTEGKEALNWQITFTIIYTALWIVTSIIGGFLWVLSLVVGLVPLAWWILNVVWSIMGGMKVNAGGSYRYPLNFRFIT
ncbi:DUF4870 domain-containing protein [Microbacterium sp.]|uniref:DUF4870 domain-containing protein n=1 Tax=Microbacterium sp. TaxID=51671 RepID=UPI0039E50291